VVLELSRKNLPFHYPTDTGIVEFVEELAGEEQANNITTEKVLDIVIEEPDIPKEHHIVVDPVDTMVLVIDTVVFVVCRIAIVEVDTLSPTVIAQ
jgi:hypothetical protein